MPIMFFERQVRTICVALITIVLAGAGAAYAQTQTTAFTYQGKLTDSGNPANSNYDLQVALFDNGAGGTQIGSTLTRSSVLVSSGIFTVQLDFGVSAFPGADRFLEIGVRPAGGGSFTTLSPRQQISSTPYAIRTLSATAADALSSACVACVQDSQINQVAGSKVNGTIPVASVPSGSTNYIQNTTSQQSSANFNISGNGIVGGNVGIGTTGPQAKLDVRGHLVLDAGTDPILYAGTNNAELNRYLQLINSPSSPSASGLKAGGILVADSYGFGNPGKSDLIVKGNTGMGLSNPVSKLHIFGSANIASPFRGLTIDQTVNLNAMTNGYAMAVTTTTSNVTSTNFLINSFGNVGVGTASPSQRLHVAQSGDFQLRLENPAAGGGFWSIGQSDNSFNSGGGKLLFVPNTTNSSSATVAFTNAGRVGIGTTNPSQLLHVNSGNDNAAALVQTPSGAFAQYQLQSGATSPWIVGTQDNFAGNALLFRNGSTDLVTIQPSGNVMQPLDKGGFVKAMVYVSSGGNIHQCYNGKTGASASGISSPDGCGFHVTHDSIGVYNVSFGFAVTDRFFALSAEHEFQACIPNCSEERNKGANYNFFGDANSLQVLIFFTDQRLSITNGAFMLVVF